jgi:uncharacterized protein YprB with RNaseH-like and TPR domain
LKIKNVLRCIHRHTIREHPSCFVNNMVVDLRKKKDEPWWKTEGHKIYYLDIETDNLNADYGTMLTWCLKEKDGDIISSVITKEELLNGTLDKRIVAELVIALQRIPITVGYYSSRFDIPFIRTKALHYLATDQNFPLFPPAGYTYHWDLYYLVKYKLKLSRNSLAAATAFLEIEGKTPINNGVWVKAKYGDKEALQEVLEHNKADVMITEALHNALSPFRNWTRSSV